MKRQHALDIIIRILLVGWRDLELECGGRLPDNRGCDLATRGRRRRLGAGQDLRRAMLRKELVEAVYSNEGVSFAAEQETKSDLRLSLPQSFRFVALTTSSAGSKRHHVII